MRDIRSDLQERATLIDEQIRAAYAHFEKTVRQLQSERDARIDELKSVLTMIAEFMELEQRFSGKLSPETRSPMVSLGDLFVRKLNEVGPMSKDDLIDLAVREGYFPNAEKARQGVQSMLANMLRSEQIRELPEDGTFASPALSRVIEFPNETFAPPTLSELRRAM